MVIRCTSNRPVSLQAGRQAGRQAAGCDGGGRREEWEVSYYLVIITIYGHGIDIHSQTDTGASHPQQFHRPQCYIQLDPMESIPDARLPTMKHIRGLPSIH